MSAGKMKSAGAAGAVCGTGVHVISSMHGANVGWLPRS